MSEDDEQIEAKRQINLITRNTFDEISRMGYSLNGKALSHEIELKTKEQHKN
jgi:hypothetical protein